MSDLVSVVMVVYERLDYLEQSCRSLIELSDHPIELIIVDDGSSESIQDGITAIFRRLPPCCRKKLLLPDRKIPAAEVYNIGLSMSRGKHLFYINDDIQVRTRGWTSRMLHHAKQHPNASIIGVVSNYAYIKQVVPREYHENDYIGQSFQIDQVSGMLCYQKRSVWDALGGYDETLPGHGGCDADWSVRCQAAGYELWIAKDVYAEHLVTDRDAENRTQYNKAMNGIQLKYGVPEINMNTINDCIARAANDPTIRIANTQPQSNLQSVEALNILYGRDFMEDVTKHDSEAGTALVNAISTLFPCVESIVDLGCANGVFLKHFLEGGYDAVGYDVSQASHDLALVSTEYIHVADLREPIHFGCYYDLAIMIETLEHIELEAIKDVLENVRRAAPLFIVTPGAQPGTGHCTCLTSEQWIPIIERYGFKYDVVWSNALHVYLSQPCWDQCQSMFPYMKKGIMVFHTC